MQSGNSIWKLTALAGCVGLGLLGLLQFQKSMSPKQTAKIDHKVRLENFKPLKDEHLKPLEDFDLSPSASSNDPPEGNTEPQRLSFKARRSEPQEYDPLEDAFDDLPPRKTATRQPASLASFDAFDDELSSNQAEPSPVFDEDAKPIPVPQNAKKQAQELIKSARKLIDYGDLDEARLKAAEAAEMSATFSLFEDTPESVLTEIDRLTTSNEPRTNDRLTAPSREPITQTGGTRQPRGLTLDMDEPNF
ncbi:MAG: hypothetical protein DWI21_15975, partial [Planctomycetota bacterium]